MYHAFNATELEILAGYIYGCQHVSVPVREKGPDDKIKIVRYELVPLPSLVKEGDLERPYTPQERFLEAVKVFVTVKNVKFENCKYHANNNTVEAIGRMDAKRENASKLVYDAIKNWDESMLENYYQKHKLVLEGPKLGFKPHPAPPLNVSHTVSELEDLAGIKEEVSSSGLTFNEPTLTTVTTPPLAVVPQEPRRSPGRPRKNP